MTNKIHYIGETIRKSISDLVNKYEEKYIIDDHYLHTDVNTT